MRHGPGSKNQIEWIAFAGDLVCDVDLAAPRVANRRHLPHAASLLRVCLLQSLRDLLQPTELGEAGATYDHPAREREPRLERATEKTEPGGARGIHLWPRPFEVGYLGVQLARPRFELDRASDVRESKQSAPSPSGAI